MGETLAGPLNGRFRCSLYMFCRPLTVNHIEFDRNYMSILKKMTSSVCLE